MLSTESRSQRHRGGEKDSRDSKTVGDVYQENEHQDPFYVPSIYPGRLVYALIRIWIWKLEQVVYALI